MTINAVLKSKKLDPAERMTWVVNNAVRYATKYGCEMVITTNAAGDLACSHFKPGAAAIERMKQFGRRHVLTIKPRKVKV